MTTTFASEFEGRVFTMPAPLVATAVNGERLALALMTGDAVRFGRDLVEDALTPGACDLGLVKSGRCPLLAEHCYSLDALLGRVVAAELDGQMLKAVVEFGPGKEADRLWAMLSAGFPLSLSAGAQVLAAEIIEKRDDHNLIRATRWRLNEVSVVVHGKDENAYVRRLTWDEDATEVVRRMQAAAGDAKRAAVENALHLDRWRRWSLVAGVGIAEDLGIDRDALCDALDERVIDQCERLIADLAA